jgi:pre-mRNA-splicing helicase BRR2
LTSMEYLIRSELWQALWDSSPNLLQLPGVSADLAKKAAEAEIETIFDLMDMEDDARNALLAMSEQKVVTPYRHPKP